EARAKDLLGFELIVRAASQADSANRCHAAPRDRGYMVELQKMGRIAAMPASADERAPLLVPLPDSTPDMHRNLTSPSASSPQDSLGSLGSEFGLLELLIEEFERSMEDLVDVPVRNGMAEQGLGAPQFLMGSL